MGNSSKRVVAELFKKGTSRISPGEVDRLRAKHGDDIADEVVEEFYEMKESVREDAQKAASYLRGKYPHKPLHLLLGAARKYKAKLGLDDFAFEEFRRIFEAQLSGQSVAMSRIVEPHRHSNIMERTLGSGYRDQAPGMKVRDDEYGDLQEILKIHAAMKPAHADVVLQHLQFTGVQRGNQIALAGYFDRTKDRPECYVHPVIAAMFLPKIPVLEKHFLIANLAGIIKGRKNRELITNKPDYLLHKAITTDPNDVVCDPNSAVRDLKFRCQMQHQLLQSVRSLRNGQYYDCANRDFLATIENCRLNNFDNPELLYGQDEATVLSKLLGAFSFRPTVLSQRPVATYDPNPKAIIPKIYTRHMLTFRQRNPRISAGAAREVKEVMINVSYRREDGHFIPYEEQVIYSNQVIFVLVPRKLMTVDLNRMLGQTTNPINLLDLPRNLTGFERVNPFELKINENLVAGEDNFNLTSAISAKISNIGASSQSKGFIIGNMAWVKVTTNQWVCYDPRIVNQPGTLRTNPNLGVGDAAADKNIKSVYSLRPMIKYDKDQFLEHAQRFGTILIYSNEAATRNMGLGGVDMVPRSQLLIHQPANY